MSNAREESVVAALSLFGVQTFVDFLREIRSESQCTAVRLANKALDQGKSVKSIFFTDEDRGFHLGVERNGQRRFTVRFGCVVGPLAGDGGTWDVVIDRRGDIVRITEEEYWIS